MDEFVQKKVERLYYQYGYFFERGQYRQAIPIAEQAYDLTRNTFGSEHPLFANSLNKLALLYHKLGDYAAAEPLYKRAVEIWQKVFGEHHHFFAVGLNNLAGLYKAMGNYSQAAPLYQKALKSLRKVVGEDHPDCAMVMDNLAKLYQVTGDYDQAESLCRQSLDIRGRTLGESHSDYASSLVNLAGLYRLMGNYEQAEPLYKRALTILRKILGELHPDYAACLNDLALLYERMGRFAEAELLYLLALRSTRASLGESHPDFATTLNNLAILYLLIGRFAEAEQLCRQSLEVTISACGEFHPDVAVSLNNIASLCYMLGKYQEAEPLHRRALAIRCRILGDDHPSCVISLNNLAELCAATGREAEAMALMQRAAAIDDRMLCQIFSIGSEDARAAFLQTVRQNFDTFLSLASCGSLSNQSTVCATLDLVLRRKAIGTEVMATQRDMVLRGKYPELRASLQDLSALRMQIAKKTLEGPGSGSPSTHQELLAGWQARKERLESDLARQIPEMNMEHKLLSISRKLVASSLGKGATLVEFVRYNSFNFKTLPCHGESRWEPARYLAFVLHAGEPDNAHMIDLGEAEPIDQMVAAFRAAITGEKENSYNRDLGAAPSGSSGGESVTIGTALRAAVFDLLGPAIGDCKRLLLAPDGDLTRLPFEVLPAGDGGSLIDDYYISYLSAGRDLLRFGAGLSVQPGESLVVADPDFDLLDGESLLRPTSAAQEQVLRDIDHGGLSFSRLPGTREEGERIAHMLGVQPLLEGGALEKHVKACRSPRVLHLATHGFFLEDHQFDLNVEEYILRALGRQGGSASSRLRGPGMKNPMLRSGLALAGANTFIQHGNPPEDAEDGILTAEDVSGLDLVDTELAVLSACDTGLGEIRTGEGVFGLRRAFVLAGAKTLVMSLWKVPDHQTRELMVAFYERVLAGYPRSEALRVAQLEMKKKHSEPFYWGAFICQGDPGPLPARALQQWQ
jgi:CHAT domain-containing protein/tetratricopeptide (TPR) repeat protein